MARNHVAAQSGLALAAPLNPPPASGYQVRRMVVADVPMVMEIEQVAKSAPWTASMYEQEIAVNEQAHPLIVAVNGIMVGYMVYWLVADELSVLTIVTAPAWRGRGLGELLLLNCLWHGAQAGATGAFLEVRRSNVVAQGLYAKYQFVQVGVRRRYYADNREDALVWGVTAVLADPPYRAFLAEQWGQWRAVRYPAGVGV